MKHKKILAISSVAIFCALFFFAPVIPITTVSSNPHDRVSPPTPCTGSIEAGSPPHFRDYRLTFYASPSVYFFHDVGLDSFDYGLFYFAFNGSLSFSDPSLFYYPPTIMCG